MDLTRPGTAAHACGRGVAVQATETMLQRLEVRRQTAGSSRLGSADSDALVRPPSPLSSRRHRLSAVADPCRRAHVSLRHGHGPERDAVRVTHLVHFPKKAAVAVLGYAPNAPAPYGGLRSR
jgi:hypothetical protein